MFFLRVFFTRTDIHFSLETLFSTQPKATAFQPPPLATADLNLSWNI